MPDAIDCTTCLYEPKWNCDGTGECRFEAYPAWARVQHYIRKKPDGDLIFCVQLGYEDDCFAFDHCFAHQLKETAATHPESAVEEIAARAPGWLGIEG